MMRSPQAILKPDPLVAVVGAAFLGGRWSNKPVASQSDDSGKEINSPVALSPDARKQASYLAARATSLAAQANLRREQELTERKVSSEWERELAEAAAITAVAVFGCVPLGVMGGVLAIKLRSLPFSIPAGVGFIALCGVAVLNGVVMASELRRCLEKGHALSHLRNWWNPFAHTPHTPRAAAASASRAPTPRVGLKGIRMEAQKRKALTPGSQIDTTIPGRLDRLPFSGWHWRVVIALGVTWILDGLEVTVVGAVAGVLGELDTLHLSETEVGMAASSYLFGAILGALLFGRLTDQLGRKRLFLITLAVYLAATLATACSVGFYSFAFFRALTGAGIGGEYAAINSAIDELLPARVRGHADLAINSTYWLGTVLGAGATIFLLDARYIPHAIGWRIVFALGAVLGAAIVLVRRHVPESPRWLLLHGYIEDAEAVVSQIEADVEQSLGIKLPPPGPPARIEVKGSVGFTAIGQTLIVRHRRRSLLGLSLMIAQAFCYNAIFFTYALVLARFYSVPADSVGLYLLPFAAGNLLGPLLLGPLFDSIGRRPMITLTYALSGLLLIVTGWCFAQGLLTAVTQTVLWSIVFFVASAAASSAYLTVSELFPVELRGMAIALFYAVGTAAGGLFAPGLFGALIQTGSRQHVFFGYLIGGSLMMGAAIVAAFLGVAAERQSLEAIAELDAPRD